MNKNYRSIQVSQLHQKSSKSNQLTNKNKASLTKTSSSSKFSKILQTAAVAISSIASYQVASASSCDGDISLTINDNSSVICDQGVLNSFIDNGLNARLIINNDAGNFSLNGSVNFGANTNEFHLHRSNNSNTFDITNQAVINMGASFDSVVLSGDKNFDFNGQINLGNDADAIEIKKNVTVNGNIHGNDGGDRFVIGVATESGNTIINGVIFGDAGDDSFDIDNINAVVNGYLRGGDGKDSFKLTSGKVSNLLGGSGDDSFIISGNLLNRSPNIKIDGENDFDMIVFQNASSEITAENLRNIESIQLGNFTAQSVELPASVNFKGSQLTLRKVGSTNNNFPSLTIAPLSEFKFSSDIFTIIAEAGVVNLGKINLRGTTPGKNLFIVGDYNGQAGSSILINTQLGTDNSATDRLIITGDAKGESKVFVQNKGGTGAKTINGINIIEVQGLAAAKFTLASPLQVGGYEYFLFKNGNFWNLVSDVNTNPNCVDCDPIKPTPEASTLAPSSFASSANTSPKIYRPAVAAYLQAAQIQFEQNASLIGTLEQRQTSSNNTGNIWGRVIADKSSHKTTTFGYDQSSQSLQFGRDIIDTSNTTNNNNHNNQTKAGVSVGLGMQSSDYSDQIRALTSTGIFTGTSDTTAFALGAYYTQRNEANPYMDLQAHLIASRTQFKDIYDGSAKQTGFGVALSAELGKDIALASTSLNITPQAQAIYQNHSFSGFNDATSDVAKQTAESLRVRAGITLQSNKAKMKAIDKTSATHWNASLNLWQEVLDNPNRTIAGSVVSSDNSQKPWLEVSIGANHTINENSSITAQISYKRSISGNQHNGNAVNLSYRFKW